MQRSFITPARLLLPLVLHMLARFSFSLLLLAQVARLEAQLVARLASNESNFANTLEAVVGELVDRLQTVEALQVKSQCAKHFRGPLAHVARALVASDQARRARNNNK